MKTRAYKLSGCVLLAVVFFFGFQSPAWGQFGKLGGLLKKGKEIAEKEDKKDPAKQDKTKKQETKSPTKASEGEIVFSKSPFDPKTKKPNLTNTFKASDNIYATISLKESFETLAKGSSKIHVEVKCYLDGKGENRGGFSIAVTKDALKKKVLVMGVAPAPDKMKCYDDPNVIYQKQFDKYGKRGGPMQLTKMLSTLPAGKHTIKLVLYRYKVLAEGEFTIEGKNFKKPYEKLFKALEAEKTKSVQMAKPKMKDAKLEAAMVEALKASHVKAAKEGEILKVVIIDPDWHLRRHKISGKILFRYIRTEVALKEKSGPCWQWRFVFKQEYIGDKFQKTKLHGIGDRKKIPLKNVLQKDVPQKKAPPKNVKKAP